MEGDGAASKWLVSNSENPAKPTSHASKGDAHDESPHVMRDAAVMNDSRIKCLIFHGATSRSAGHVCGIQSNQTRSWLEPRR